MRVMKTDKESVRRLLKDIRREKPWLLGSTSHVTRKDVRRLQIALHPDRVTRAQGRVRPRDLEFSQLVNVLYESWPALGICEGGALALDDFVPSADRARAPARAPPRPRPAPRPRPPPPPPPPPPPKCTIEEAILRDAPVSAIAPGGAATPELLAQAAMRWNHQICEHLLGAGADPKNALLRVYDHPLMSSYGVTCAPPPDYRVTTEDLAATVETIKRGSKPGSADEALLHAAHHTRTSVLLHVFSALCSGEHPADVKRARAALGAAIAADNFWGVAALLMVGVDPYARDERGRTAWDHLRADGCAEGATRELLHHILGRAHMGVRASILSAASHGIRSAGLARELTRVIRSLPA